MGRPGVSLKLRARGRWRSRLCAPFCSGPPRLASALPRRRSRHPGLTTEPKQRTNDPALAPDGQVPLRRDRQNAANVETLELDARAQGTIQALCQRRVFETILAHYLLCRPARRVVQQHRERCACSGPIPPPSRHQDPTHRLPMRSRLVYPGRPIAGKGSRTITLIPGSFYRRVVKGCSAAAVTREVDLPHVRAQPGVFVKCVGEVDVSPGQRLW